MAEVLARTEKAMVRWFLVGKHQRRISASLLVVRVDFSSSS